MTGVEWVSIIGAIAAALVAIIGAIARLYVLVGRTHKLVNSRMDQLLASVKSASLAEGKLAGPDQPPFPRD